MTAKRLIDKTSIALLDAASLIENYGWWNGKKYPHSKLCAFMAIDLACEDTEGDSVNCLRQAAYTRLEKHIGNLPIIDWNDGSDAVTVVTTMRNAAMDA